MMKILDFFKKKPVEKEKPLFTVPGWSAIQGRETEVRPETLPPMITFDALPPEYAAEARDGFTQWRNRMANINAGNSLNRHNEYILGRVSYQECASLATDTLISKAVTTIVNEMFKEGGKWEIPDADEEFLKGFEDVCESTDITGTVRLACRRALEYGGAFVYIDTTDDDVSSPLFLSRYTLSERRLKGFRVLEPWQTAPITVNTWNPLSADYMRPTRWYVMGAGQNVHYTRLIPVSFFDVPELLKPVFNYQGLPLSFFMRSFVGSAEVSRQCIADLMLRFRTDYIKTTAQKIADPKTRDRVKFMNQTRNNFGMALLSSDEELTQINTPLSGLDSLLSQMYELVTMTTGMPVTKFLGLSPRGFNATGEHDQNNYYDLIAGYENNIARPVLERMGRAVSVLKLTGGYTPKYVFNPLNRLTKTEAATLDNLKADYLKKLDELGVITAEDALRAVKEDDFSFSWVENPPEQDDGGFDFGDMEAAARPETMDAAWRKEDHPKGRGGRFVKTNGGGEESATANEIERLIDKALNAPNERQKVNLGMVDERLNRDAKANGYDIDGYSHDLDIPGVRHAYLHHGNAKVEASRGQIAITDEDIKKIPDIIKNYDNVEFPGKSRTGLDVIGYTKKVSDGTVYYMEEIRNGRKTLTILTLYKKENK